jgi:2-oxoisovalerate dehydrogenase E1 component beta subunit
VLQEDDRVGVADCRPEEALRVVGRGGDHHLQARDVGEERLDGPVTRLAGPDSPASPNALPLEEAFMLSPAKIADAIRTLAAY